MRIACSAASRSPAAIASTIFSCSASDFCGAAGCEHRAELEADDLRVQARADVERDLVPEISRMRRCSTALRSDIASSSPRALELLHVLHERLQLARLRLRGAQRGVAGGERLERGARLEDLDRLLDGEAPHARAAVALAQREALVAEAQDRAAHRAAAEPEPLRELLLDEPLPGRQLAGDDRVVEGRVGVGLAHLRGAYQDKIVDDPVIVRPVSGIGIWGSERPARPSRPTSRSAGAAWLSTRPSSARASWCAAASTRTCTPRRTSPRAGSPTSSSRGAVSSSGWRGSA